MRHVIVAAFRRRRASEAGFTLVEVLLAGVLTVVVCTVTTTAFIGGQKTLRLTDDETSGLADVKTAAERLTQDIRNSRAVLCNPAGTSAAVVADDPTCTRHLQLWIDYNSDYVLQPATETVTWSLVNATAAGHHNLTRMVGATTQTVARTIVSQVAFQYDLQPSSTEPAPGAPHTTVVNTSMVYDSRLIGAATARTVSFSARLRNVR